MPEDIGGSAARTPRIGLGPLTARPARVEAELLAALARARFEPIRAVRIQEDHPGNDEGDIAPVIAAAEVKGYLIAMRSLLKGSPPPLLCDRSALQTQPINRPKLRDDLFRTMFLLGILQSSIGPKRPHIREDHF